MRKNADMKEEKTNFQTSNWKKCLAVKKIDVEKMEVRGWFTGKTESGAYLENRKANHGNKQIGIKIFLQSSTAELIDLMIEGKSQLFLLGKNFLWSQ